jgi:hypothetical protein
MPDYTQAALLCQPFFFAMLIPVKSYLFPIDRLNVDEG